MKIGKDFSMLIESGDFTGADELQHRHLCGCVLHCDSVRTQSQIASPTHDILLIGII